MEAVITIGILVFLFAVIGVVLLGPGGDGLRRESSSPKSFGFRSLAGTASAGSGRVVNQRSYPIRHYPGPDHADAAPMVSNGLVACGESRSDFDPTEFHHTNNFTL